MNNIIITGATSMLGISLIEQALVNEVRCIYAVVRPNSEKIHRLPESDKIKIIELNICDYNKLTDIITEPCDVFYHFAWMGTGVGRNSSVFSQCDNIQVSLNALHIAKELGCAKFIASGSQAEYGVLDVKKITPDSPARPVQNYGIAKYAAGRLVMNEAETIGIKCFWVRVFSVYGIYDKPTTMVSNTISNFLSNESPKFTKAEQMWDYLYSEDAGRAFYLIGEKSEESKVYCLGSGKAKQLKEYIYCIRDCINKDINIKLGDIPYSKNSIMNLCADITDLTNDTGWVPEYSFKNGIQEILCKRRITNE